MDWLHFGQIGCSIGSAPLGSIGSEVVGSCGFDLDQGSFMRSTIASALDAILETVRNDDSIRLADVPIPKVWVWFMRSWAFPIYGLVVLLGMRRNSRKASAGATQLGETAAQVVIEAQRGARTLRRLTYAIVLLTLVNTGFVIYSAVK